MEMIQDVWGIIFKMIPFGARQMTLVNKYFYNTYHMTKKRYATYRYVLTPIQERMIQDMQHHIASDTDKSLIIQSQLSTGKTASILAFALKTSHTVVILVPPTTLPHWHQEVIKMIGQCGFDHIAIMHRDYSKDDIYDRSRFHKHNPEVIGKKISIVSTATKINTKDMLTHSLVIQDEIHKRGSYNRIKHPHFIGVTASATVDWHDYADIQIYLDEEVLPTVIPKHIIMATPQMLNVTINEIKSQSPGPYLIISSPIHHNMITQTKILYDRKLKTLQKINKVNDHDVIVLNPGNDATGINLLLIKTVIFVYPTDHMTQTVIQCLGRVTRATSRHQKINVFYLHSHQNDIIYQKSMVKENDIVDFCKQHRLRLLHSIRNKYFITNIIKSLLTLTTFEILNNIPDIYYAIISRIHIHDFKFLMQSFGKYIHDPHRELLRIFS